MKTAAALLSAILLCLPAPSDTVREKILSFDSDVTVQEDGSLTVREEIKVRSAGRSIRHGIYRDFPVAYAGRGGTRRTVPFEVVEVLRDGKPEGWHVEDRGDYRRVYMGRKDVILEPGEYVYTLVYRTDRQLGFFEDHDELYWNVTGNFWEFRIDAASCTVTLPEGVPRGRIVHEAYTGRTGAKGRNYTSEVLPDGKVFFKTTRALGLKEGLTVVVTWPKGHVKAPGAGRAFSRFVGDNALVAVTAMGLVVVFLYYFLAWRQVGRDPEKGLVIPLFEPPDGMSPAAVRYVRRMGFDNRCFSAAVVNAAVKGHLAIQQNGSGYALLREEQPERLALAPEEEALVGKLLAAKDRIELDDKHHERFQRAMTAVREALSEQYEGRLFHENLLAFIPGVAIAVSSVLVGAAAEGAALGWAGAWHALRWCFWTAVAVFLAYRVPRALLGLWRQAARKGGLTGVLIILVFPLAALGALAFFARPLYGLRQVAGPAVVLVLPMVVAMCVLILLFYYLLKAPTEAGRKVMDGIDGFRMYLATAEGEQLNVVHPPERTPELFERYLPYALALGVENQWAEKFAGVLAAAALERDGGYAPVWYHGRTWHERGADGLTSSLGRSFAGALSAASSAGASGAGGGGSAGGGGGGGGGGGW